MTYNLNYIRILSNHYVDAFDFYSNKLGFEVKMGDASSGYAEFKTDGAILSLFNAKDMASALGMDHCQEVHECSFTSTIIFRVDNVDKEYERLKSNGVIFLSTPKDRKEWSVRTAHFRDLDGNLIEINQAMKS